MYSERNFKSKKELKEAVARGDKIRIYQPNDMFGNPKAGEHYTGKAYLEGPHYPEPHKWYAEVDMEDGVIVKVR